MMLLFNNKEELIRIVRTDALRTLDQTQKLTDENYISNQLYVETKALDEDILTELEYIAIPVEDQDYQYHYFWVKNQSTEGNITTLQGVESGIEELRKTPVYDVRPTERRLYEAVDQVLRGTNWTSGFTADTGVRSTTVYYTSVFEALKHFANVWNVEFQFFVEITNNKIGNRHIEFRQKIGVNNGQRVVYGHNALEILKEVERDELYTALIGRGKGEEVSNAEDNPGGQSGYGRKINFSDVAWSISDGDPVDKPAGQQYVELPEATALYGIKQGNTVRPKVGFTEFNEEEDKEVLLQRTYEELIRLSRPQMTLRTTSVYLAGSIGDTIRVVRPDRHIDFNTRIFELVIDRLGERPTDFKLGDKLNESAPKRENRLVNTAINKVNDEFPEMIENITHQVISADGGNYNYYGVEDPRDQGYTPRVNDMWFQPDPDDETETILYVWNGEFWEETLRTADTKRNAREIEHVLELAQQAKEDAYQSYVDSTEYTDDIVENETERWNQEFTSTVNEINQDVGDVRSKADKALTDAGANADLIDTHENILSDIENVTLPNINETLNNVQQNIIPGIEQDISDAWNHADSALTDAQQAMTNTDELYKQTNDISLDIDEIQGTLDLKADSQTVDKIAGTVETNSADISVNADEISRRLTSTEVDNLVDNKGFSTVSYVDSQITESAESIYGSMEATQADFAEQISGISLQDKTEILSGTEIYTDKADDSVVHVEVDGKSYQDGEPTPDYPIKIHSLNDFDVVSSVGKRNYLPDTEFSNGIVNYHSSKSWYLQTSGTLDFDNTEVRDSSIYVDARSTTDTRVYSPTINFDTSTDYIYSFELKYLEENEADISVYITGVIVSGSSGANQERLTRIRTEALDDGFVRYYYRLGKSIFDRYSERRNDGNLSIFNGKYNQNARTRYIFRKPKLEKGSDITPYNPDSVDEGEQHPLIDKINLLLSEPLRSVGEVHDRLFRDSDGLWKVERNVEWLNVDNSNVSFYPGYHTDNYYSFTIRDKAGHTKNIESTHLPKVSNVWSTEQSGIYTSDYGIWLQIPKSFVSSVSELKTKGIEIQYEANNPTIEIIDQELQDKLNNLRSFQDSNYVYSVINDKTDILSERLKPTLHAVFKGGGWYEQFATDSRIRSLSNDFEVTAEGITQDLNAFKQKANGEFSNLNTQIETVAGEQTRQYEEITGQLNNKLENSDLSGYATESYVNTEITEGINGVITRIESVESTQDSLSTSINNTKATADGNKNTITNIQNNPENTIVGYQQVTETADLYERVIGSSENDINDNVSRIIATSDVIQTEVSSMEFGGRNLAKGTSDNWESVSWSSWNATVNEKIYVEPSQYYTISVDYKDVDTPNNVGVGLRLFWYDKDGTRDESRDSDNIADGEEGRINFTLKAPSNAYTVNIVLRQRESTSGGSAKYRNLKLEKGTVATDWTPAPEDQTAYTDSAVSTVQTQLDNSWAVQTLNSNEDVMAEIAVTDSTARIQGKNILLDGNVSMTNAYITDLEALSINAVEGDITRLITDHLQANTITSKHIVSSLSMIDKLFGNDAYIQRLTTKNAFIESIQTTSISADQIVTGEINSAVANTVFLNADSGSFDTAYFIQTAWNNISTQITIDDRGIMISGNDRWRRTHHNQTGFEFYNGSGSNNRAGAMGYFKTTYDEADWNENVMLTGGRRLRHSIGMGADPDHVLAFGYTPDNTTDRTYISALEIDPTREGHITALTEATFEKPVNLTSPRITDANGATGGFLTRPTTLGISMISEAKVSLGIGTRSSWNDRLVVAGNVDLYTDLSMRNFNILRAGRIEFESTGTTYIDASEGRMRYWANDMHTFVDGNGSAMLQLQSNGYANMYNRLNMQGNDIYNASDFRTTSDRRLKTEIEEYENNILEDFFEPINPVTYFWKEQSKSQEQQFGLIAQETPLISDYDAVSDLWNISMSKQVMVNTFGVKELLDRDNDKENRISYLESKIKGLEKEINQLKGVA